jgi:hypothetical protein
MDRVAPRGAAAKESQKAKGKRQKCKAAIPKLLAKS